MKSSKNKFTLKIILSYLMLSCLFVLAGVFLYSEIENLIPDKDEPVEGKKIIETGTLINLLYETDGFYRLALLNEKDSDFEKYMSKTDSLFKKIEEVKSLSINPFQRKQLDSVKLLLEEKNKNIDQLRILRLTNNKDTSLDDILKEVKKLEVSIGKNTVESMVRNPSKLSNRDRKVWEAYADYLNQDLIKDTSTVKSKTVDSMLIAARYIVAEAKKENSRIRRSLTDKENELIRNDLEISAQLREIISSFDAEIARKNNREVLQQKATMSRTGDILKLIGIIGGIVILLFSYFILSDFFKAERFKKNLEKEKNYSDALLKSRGQLISTVSHDLKTPLNTITGYSELFENSSLTEKQKYYLQQITSSSYFISQLVDDLLDYSKLEAGKLPIESLPFSLENIILESGNAAKQVYSNNSVNLEISISEKIKNTYYESDPLRIRQIINNLVGNAFKFTENGIVEIIAEEVDRYNQTSVIQIRVKDSGIGISHDKLETIFQEFTQAEDDTSHKFGGSGLGLAISKKLTLLLNGNLNADSELGKGSVFTLELPLKISDKSRVSEVASKTKIGVANLKALIIDDDEAMRSLLKEMFKGIDIYSETFGDYKDFQKIDLDSFDFLLTDIQMPGTDGLSILKELQSEYSHWNKDKPIIAMTGNREFSRAYYLEKGFTDILFKPFSRTELTNLLSALFSIEFPGRNIEYEVKEEATSDLYDLSLLNSFLISAESLEEVLGVFDIETKKDIQFLKEAIKQSNYKGINAVSHRMLTMFRQIQAKNIIPILEEMENYIENKPDSPTMAKDLEKLKFEVGQLQESLQEKGFYKPIL